MDFFRVLVGICVRWFVFDKLTRVNELSESAGQEN